MFQQNIIYHYCTGNKIDSIISSAVIKTSPLQKILGARSEAVWLSKNKDWEPSANAMVSQFGRPVLLTKKQTFELYGLARIGILFDELILLSWAHYKRHSGICLDIVQLAERDAKSIGANTNDWYYAFSRIYQLHWGIVQTWNGHAWIKYN